ncbi:phosphoribosyl-AMP cyclohydrolase [Candidatus Bathycorpusculum sp.]|uniref:phosphoribosyl-AMP cyclohydrolase n=1 Tax=Candidatus Bathycorpusculum sp. TaxID=2994959 RepID=UPI0031CC9B9A
MTPTELLKKLDFTKGNGLIPVITQDAKTKTVLMQAYANKEAVELTLKTKKATYWSRSRNEIWIKGETSGNTQKIISISTDCDCDSLLYLVEQTGPACHTGEYSCFYNQLL